MAEKASRIEDTDLYFEKLTEHRGDYFIEYSPPRPAVPHSTLYLVYPGSFQREQVRTHMETEARRWLDRYPVPIWASAWDKKEDAIKVFGDASESFLLAWLNSSNEIELSIGLARSDEFSRMCPASVDLEDIFRDIPFKTKASLRAKAEKEAMDLSKGFLLLKIALVFWLAIVPASIALLEYFGPQWLETIVLIYSLWKAWQTYQRILGHAKQSAKEKDDEAKKTKMGHYYYHCERNPDGFRRLLVENLEADAVERVRLEAEKFKE